MKSHHEISKLCCKTAIFRKNETITKPNIYTDAKSKTKNKIMHVFQEEKSIPMLTGKNSQPVILKLDFCKRDSKNTLILQIQTKSMPLNRYVKIN